MLVDLKTAINNTVPFLYPYFKRTYPDIITFSYKHRGQFQKAAEEARLEYVMYAHDTSPTAMEYRGVDHYMNEDAHKPCGRNIDTIATITLTGACLETSLFQRHQRYGTWEPIRTMIGFDLGSDGSVSVREPEAYLGEKIEDKVVKFIHEEVIDRVLVLGEPGDNADFQKALRWLFLMMSCSVVIFENKN